MTPQGRLKEAAKTGDVEGVRDAIAAGADPKFENSIALIWASHNGHIECIRELIPISDPKARDSLSLFHAARSGYIECVRLLIPVSDPKAMESWALSRAAENGHIKCIRELILVSDVDTARAKLERDEHFEAIGLLDLIAEEEFLKGKYLKPDAGTTRASL